MGNAVLIQAPTDSESFDEDATRAAFGKYWDDDIAVRFRTMAEGAKWTRLPPTPFDEGEWVKENTGYIRRDQFEDLVQQAKYNVETKVDPVTKTQVDGGVGVLLFLVWLVGGPVSRCCVRVGFLLLTSTVSHQ